MMFKIIKRCETQVSPSCANHTYNHIDCRDCMIAIFEYGTCLNCDSKRVILPLKEKKK